MHLETEQRFSGDLVKEALEFLFTNKVSEVMSEELRQILFVEIYTNSGSALSASIAEAAKAGKQTFITGTAGGGKTMLIEKTLEHLRRDSIPFHLVTEMADVSRIDHSNVLVVSDLTAIFDSNAEPLIEWCKSGRAAIIAANEGALMYQEFNGTFDDVVQNLREMQQGLKAKVLPNHLVIDIAAIDPVAQALEQLLGHPLLHAAALLHCENSLIDSEKAIREESLIQLKNEGIVSGFAKLAAQTISTSEFTFRELWIFVADILVGADEFNPLGELSLAWFWRAFAGETRLAKELAAATLPLCVSKPEESLHLWTGDYSKLSLSADLMGMFIFPSHSPRETVDDLKLLTMNWLRLQLVILQDLPAGLGQTSLPGLQSTGLNRLGVASGNPEGIVKLLNGYFRQRVLGANDSNPLELWVDLQVERRQVSTGLVSLGEVALSRLRVIHSTATLGLIDDEVSGNRVYLSYFSEEGVVDSLELDRPLIDSLGRGRNSRSADRTNDDVELAISTFFFSLSEKAQREDGDGMAVLIFEGDGLPRESKWSVSNGLLENVGRKIHG